MNKFSKKILSLCLLIAVLCTLTACSREDPVHLALVVLHHSNAPVPDMTHAQGAITQVCENGGSFHVIEGDGNPYLFASYDLEAPEGGVSANTREKDVKKRLNKLISAAESCVPRTERADPLGALDMGGRALVTADTGEKKLIVIGSGLSDCWPLDMSSQGVCVAQMDPALVVSSLETAGAIPQNLRGCRVVWYGVGETCPPQDALGPKDVQNLKAVWTAILEAAGAQVEFPEDLSVIRQPAEGLPMVNTVAVQPREEEAWVLPTEVQILEGSVAFGGDSAKLKNLDQVNETLAPLVETLKNNPQCRLALFGGTARAGGQDSCRRFGQQRADAVREHLISLGVQPEQVIALGIGWDHHLHEQDLKNDGTINEDVAPRNRVVYMVDAESPDALVLLAQFG